MKAFKLSNVFTVVGFVLATVSAFEAKAVACGGGNYASKEACISSKTSNSRSSCTTEANNSRTQNPTGPSFTELLNNCIAGRREEAESSCGACPSQSDNSAAQSRCESLLSSYNDTSRKTREECARSGVASINACIEAANRCTGSFAGISNSTDSNNPLAAAMNLLSISNTIGSTPASSSDCTLEEDADKKQQKADRIQSLRDEQQDSVTAQAELDGEIADKQKEVNEEIRKNKDEIQQSMRDLDKEDREKFADIQKKLLESKKKKFKNMISINKTNTEIANLEFAQQQINIEFGESKIARKCFEKVMEIKNKLVPQAAPPVPGQPAVPPARNFSLKEAQRIKQQLRDEESDCLRTERLSRSAQLKGKIDRRQELTDTISQANQDIADEDAAIKLDQEDYDKFKASLSTEKQQKLESQTQMEANLNASLTAFEALVAKKKAALDAKIASREALIQQLLLAKTEQRQRYSEVSASLGDREESLGNFRSTCCNDPNSRSRSTSRSGTGSSTTTSYYDAANCTRLQSNSGPSILDPFGLGTGGNGQQ